MKGKSRGGPERKRSLSGNPRPSKRPPPPQPWGPPFLLLPPHRHFERSRPTFFLRIRSCECVGLRREKSLFSFSCGRDGICPHPVGTSRMPLPPLPRAPC